MDQQVGRPAEAQRPMKTSETVAHRIVSDIVTGGLAPGTHLPPEAAMLEQHRVSRASLREALRLLEVQGLISLKPGPGGGPVVGTPEPVNLARTMTLYFHMAGMRYADLFELQMSLEPLCADSVARNDAERNQIRSAFAPFLDTEEHPLVGGEYYTATHDFHHLVYRFTTNPMLAMVTSAISLIVTTHVVATMDPVERRPKVVTDHGELATAFMRGQATKARTIMTDHYQSLTEFYRAKWPARFDELVEWR